MAFKFKTDLQAVIFDFDGTIYDSTGPGLERILEIVTNAGYPIPQDIKRALESIWGTNGIKIIEVAFDLDAITSEKLYKIWEQADNENFFSLLANANKVLVNLKKNMNLRVALLTGRNRKNLITVMSHYGLPELFDAIQCRDDYAFAKPDPRSFDHILSLLNAPKNACLYVGDTIDDWRCATDAGIKFVGVETGLLKRLDWQTLGLESKNIISDIGWLPTWILKHF